MEEGALGVGSSLIYAPAFYAKTPELIALMQAASPFGGMYISHMRSEGNRLLEAVDELITIARESNAPAEIYHLKAAAPANWGKMDSVIAKVNAARAAGLAITADMYTYPAGATGLDAAMPPWVQEGGYEAWAKRLRDPAITRARHARDAHADERVGEPAARRRLAGEGDSRRLQERQSQAAHRQDARRKSHGCAASRPRRRRWTS